MPEGINNTRDAGRDINHGDAGRDINHGDAGRREDTYQGG